MPDPSLSVLGIEGRGLGLNDDPQMPIIMAMFDTSPRTPENVSGMKATLRTEGGLLRVEVYFPPGITPVRLGLDGVRHEDFSSFAIDYANGELIRGIESFTSTMEGRYWALR